MNDLVTYIGYRYNTFDPFGIAEKLNIDVQFKDFDGEPKGETVNFFGRPIILLNDELKYSNQKYFVCAHELAHALEHVDMSAYYISNRSVKNQFEYQADQFAVALLTCFYREEFDTLPNTYGDLMREYGSPKQYL
ncbi:hypothetical protein IV37_GL000144 [Fructilactobacillus fructivorans]|nr:hypothetical protein IV37_GL000144 [Fructilactobacillus fructivorans]